MRALASPILAAVVVLAASACHAVPVLWGSHWYEPVHVAAGITWTNASTAAQGVGGYLATSTSAAENTFLFSLIDQPQFWWIDTADNNEGPWLGGFFTGSSMHPTNGWNWVSGETWSYTNWDNGEPNFLSEKQTNFFSNDASRSNPIRQSFWNNVGDASPMNGYIVEYDQNPIPEPGTILLLGSGLLGVVAARWNRRRPA